MAPGLLRSLLTQPFQSKPTRGATGKPCSAYLIAGASARASEEVPCAFSSASQASIAPGTLTACGGGGEAGDAVAGEAGDGRLDQEEARNRRHRGVDRIAAGAQHVDGGEARQRMRGRSHAVACDDGRAAGQLEIAAHLKLLGTLR